MTDQVHRLSGHGDHDLIDQLSETSDSFGTVDLSSNPTREQLARQTHQAAHDLLRHAAAVYRRTEGGAR